MNHAITVKDFLLVLLALGSFVLALFGVLMFAAGSMSDAPVEGDATGKQGCIMFVIGAVILIGSLWALIA